MVLTEHEIFDIRRFIDSEPGGYRMHIVICGLPGVGKYSFLAKRYWRLVHANPVETTLRRADALPRRRRRHPNPLGSYESYLGRRDQFMSWNLQDWVGEASSVGDEGGAASAGKTGERIPKADGYLLCYDVGDRGSFEGLREIRAVIAGVLEKVRGNLDDERDDKGVLVAMPYGLRMTELEDLQKQASTVAEVHGAGSEEAMQAWEKVKLRGEQMLEADQKRGAEKIRRAEKPIFVLACKSDRPAEAWEVSEMEGAAFAHEIGARFAMCSAIRGEGVREVSDEIMGRVLLACFEVLGASLEEPLARPRKSILR